MYQIVKSVVKLVLFALVSYLVAYVSSAMLGYGGGQNSIVGLAALVLVVLFVPVGQKRYTLRNTLSGLRVLYRSRPILTVLGLSVTVMLTAGLFADIIWEIIPGLRKTWVLVGGG